MIPTRTRAFSYIYIYFKILYTLQCFSEKTGYTFASPAISPITEHPGSYSSLRAKRLSAPGATRPGSQAAELLPATRKRHTATIPSPEGESLGILPRLYVYTPILLFFLNFTGVE